MLFSGLSAYEARNQNLGRIKVFSRSMNNDIRIGVVLGVLDPVWDSPNQGIDKPFSGLNNQSSISHIGSNTSITIGTSSEVREVCRHCSNVHVCIYIYIYMYVLEFHWTCCKR